MAAKLSRGELPHGRSLPRLGFGASSLWAKPSFDPTAALAVAMAAVDEGIHYIDTGPSYANGEAERRVGQLVSVCGAERLIVSTKFGTVADDQGRLHKDFRPDQVLPSVQASLQRLRLERVDMLLLHSPTLGDLGEDLMEALLRTVERGLVGAIGLWSHDPTVHMAALNRPFHVHMLQYNYVDRRCAPVLDALRGTARIVINGTALSQGIFNARNFLPTDRRSAWYLARLMKNNPAFPWHYLRLKQESARLGLSPLQTVLRTWLLHDTIDCGVFGSTRVENVRANAAAARAVLGVDASRWQR